MKCEGVKCEGEMQYVKCEGVKCEGEMRVCEM